ncbi:MAG: hypothetical protein M3Q56_06435 [Bacteroidota bacterium]|nr:hypothetical protein [Bacteroidota bacterium]
MILLLTGPIRSFKTTSLKSWADARSDCGGVLSPDVEGLRHLYSVSSKELIPWQRKEVIAGDISIGRFAFDPLGFDKGALWMMQDLHQPHINNIILDEVGLLELDGKGWDSLLKEMLPLLDQKTLILVVRDTLVDEVIEKYELTDFSIVEKEYFM